MPMSMIYEEGPERVNELPPAELALRKTPWRPLPFGSLMWFDVFLAKWIPHGFRIIEIVDWSFMASP